VIEDVGVKVDETRRDEAARGIHRLGGRLRIILGKQAVHHEQIATLRAAGCGIDDISANDGNPGHPSTCAPHTR
jgi:hypothetical protein